MLADLTFCSILVIASDIYLLSEDSVFVSDHHQASAVTIRLCSEKFNFSVNLVNCKQGNVGDSRRGKIETQRGKLNCAPDPILLTMHPIKVSPNLYFRVRIN